jgi:hypothetical protein
MARAMGLGIPDRVPVMCQLSIGHMLLQTGFSPAEFWNSADVFAEALISLADLYGFDGILISLHGHSPRWREKIIRLERTPEGERIDWAGGDSTVYPADDLPLHRPAREPGKPVLSAFDPESFPDDLSYIPVSRGLRFAIDPDLPYRIFDLVLARAGDRLSVHGEVASPFDYFLDIFGFEQSMSALIDSPERCRDILERLTSSVVALALGQAGSGVDAVKISSPFAGAGFLSPGHYREFVLPCESRLCRALREHGVHTYLHTCGDIHDRLEMMAESGASGIECLDPPPLGGTDLAEAKARIGGKVFIKGNIDPVGTLLNGTPQSVRDDARERVLIGKPGGGYILSSACSVAPRTPRRNLLALKTVAEEFGGYGADGT